MFRSRPLIGVTGPDRGGWPAWFFTRLQIWLAGGRARRITPAHPGPTADLSGLIIGGGADINPARYHQQVLKTIHTEAKKVARPWGLHFIVSIGLWIIRRLFSVDFNQAKNDLPRDEMEFKLLREALARGIPVLGICRGGQLINVHFGGSLYQDLQNFYVEKPNLKTLRARKNINVKPGTTLNRILETDHTRVNSLHRQSVNQVGDGLIVAASEANGVVQAIEHPGYPFVIGVQWHPEFLPTHWRQRRVFHYLVEAALVHSIALHAGEIAPSRTHPAR